MRLSTFIRTAILTIGLCVPLNAGAQGWVARYNGPANGDDRGTMIAVDASGNTYVAGDSMGTGTGLDILTVKYAPDGSQVWARRYNGPANLDDVAWNLALDPSGNVYVSGRAGITFQDTDYLTIKYDSNGNQLWAKRYNGPGNREDVPYSLHVDSSGNAYVTGYSYGGVTNWDFATVKYDASGNQLWASRYADPSEDTALSMAVDAAGCVYVAGRSWRGSTTGRYDFRVVKYDMNGAQLWTALYNGPANWDDEAAAIGVDQAGNVYVAGYSTGNGTGTDYTTIKFDPGGTRLWVARYDGPAHNSDAIAGIAVEPGGVVWVTGASRATATTSGFATIKYDTLGAQLWLTRRDSTGGLGGARYVMLDGNGNGFVAGQDYVNGSLDLAVAKYDMSGVELWQNRYDGPAHGEDFAYSLTMDSYGNVFAGGGSQGSGSGRDLIAVKYALGAILTAVSASDVSGAIGQTIPLSASLSASGGSGISGLPIAFKIDGIAVAGSPATTNASGIATINYTIPEGSAGSHALTASFAGDSNHIASSATASLVVEPAGTALSVDNAAGDAGETVTIKLKLQRQDGVALSGKTIRFEVAGNAAGSSVTDSEGNAAGNYLIPATSSGGDLQITAFFDGDADYTSSTGTATLSVRLSTSVTVFNASGKTGATVTLKAILQAGASGLSGKSVRFVVDGQPVGTASTDAAGVSELPHILTESSGVHALRAEFDGDAQSKASISDTAALTVNMTRTTLYVANVSAEPGKTIKLKATLVGAGVVVEGQPITFKIDGTSIGQANTNAEGIAHLAHLVTESLGSHAIAAEYAGDGSHYLSSGGTATLTVNAISTSLIVPNVQAYPNQSIELKAKLRSRDQAISGRMITFKVDGISVGQAQTDSNGVATLAHAVTESLGTHAVSAIFEAEGEYAGSIGEAALKVRGTAKIDVDSIRARAGICVAFGARMVQMPDGAGISGKKLLFYSGDRKVGCGTTNSEGRATIQLKVPAAGTRLTIKVAFEGDAQYRPISGLGKLEGLK